MKVKNNYIECLTNLACFIRKCFVLEFSHNTLGYIDNILNNKSPKIVVLLLFDSMWSKILDRTLNKMFF